VPVGMVCSRLIINWELRERSQRVKITECTDKSLPLKRWYDSALGQEVLQASEHYVGGLLETGFGYHLLQIGVAPDLCLFRAARIHHCIYQAPVAGAAVSLRAHGEEIPLESDSIDVLIVHHGLEFSLDPYQMLREIQRVLAPQGQLIVIGFNPFSLLGSGLIAKGWLRRQPWRSAQLLSTRRLSDWLRLLGCEPQRLQHLVVLPHWGPGRAGCLVRRVDHSLVQHNCPLGGVFVMHAVKKVATLTPIRAARVRRPLLGLVPKPAQQPSPRGEGSAGRQA